MSQNQLLSLDDDFAPYTYQPLTSLRHIRVLVLEPGPWEQALSCTIEQIDLADPDGCNPNYEALSYVWGDPKPVGILSCGDGYLPVAENLRLALLYLRRTNGERILWIDAICIDQSNVKERGIQVLRMSEIYYEAGRVVIWLGESDSTTPDGIAYLESLGERLKDAQSKTPLRFDFQDADENEINQHLAYQDPTLSTSAPLRNILCRPWFSRAWTFQEGSISRAAIVYCGHYEMPWATVSHAASYLDVAPRPKDHVDTTMIVAMDSAWESMKANGLTFSFQTAKKQLLDLLCMTSQRCDATDPRDKVYAFLGMTVEGRREELFPNYELSLREVYTTTACEIIKSSNSLVLLSMAEDKSIPDDEMLPSWVPDWRRRHNAERRSPFSYPDMTHYGASGQQTLDAGFLVWDRFAILVTGMPLSMISKVWSVIPAAELLVSVPIEFKADFSWNVACPEYLDKPMDEQKRAGFAETFDLPYDFSSRKAESIASAYGRTLLADQWYFSERCTETDRLLYFPPEFAMLELDNESDPDDVIIVDTTNVEVFTRTARGLVQHTDRIMVGRKAFRTQDGMIGLCPQTALEGDCIAILFGADVPFLLRPAVNTDNRPKWTVIGECYVHGFMDGEALQQLDNERRPKSVFHLV